MIDIENELFTEIANALRNEFRCFVSNVYVRKPPSFPAIFIEEKNNAMDRTTQDSSNAENTALVMYQVDVFSNLNSGGKAECKKIIGFIDAIFANYDFQRSMCEPIPNLDDATIFRMTARYNGRAGKNRLMYRTR